MYETVIKLADRVTQEEIQRWRASQGSSPCSAWTAKWAAGLSDEQKLAFTLADLASRQASAWARERFSKEDDVILF